MKYLLFSALLFVKFAALPNQNMLFWMGVAIALDFLFGVTKAVYLKEARTSQGYRKTIIKFVQYGGALCVGVVLAHAAQEHQNPELKTIIQYFNDGLVLFIIYIEVTSIFENLAAIDQTSLMAKYFILPIHRLLTAQIKKTVPGGDDRGVPRMPNHPAMPPGPMPPGPMPHAPLPTDPGVQ